MAVSEGGTLVYRTENASSDARLELVDTSGVVRSLPGSFGVHGTPRFSPDRRRIVVGLGTTGVQGRRLGIGTADLWVIDVASGQPTRLTSDASGISPSWFANGQRVVFSADVEGKPVLRSVPVDGSAPRHCCSFGVAPRYSTMAPDGDGDRLSLWRWLAPWMARQERASGYTGTHGQDGIARIEGLTRRPLGCLRRTHQRSLDPITDGRACKSQ